MNRNSSRAGFVASAVIHSMVLLALMQWRVESPPITPPAEEVGPEPEPIARIRFPPPDVLRPAGAAPAPPAAPAPTPTPRPQPETRDRVSIGGPAPVRQQGPLVLRRDEELTRTVARGRPDAPEAAASPAVRPSPASASLPPPTLVADGVADLPLAPLGTPPRVPRPDASASPGPSIAGSLRNLEERLAAGADVRGLDTGTGQQMGPFFFDPKGADFTAWANHLRSEVYRNWIVPPSVTMGIRGHVEIEFRVERDGTLSGLRIARSSGTESLDRAARNALLGSRPMPLPPDYGPAQLALTVTFFYNEMGAGS